MHFMKVEKWFLMLLKVEYFHHIQLRVQVIQVYQLTLVRVCDHLCLKTVNYKKYNSKINISTCISKSK